MHARTPLRHPRQPRRARGGARRRARTAGADAVSARRRRRAVRAVPRARPSAALRELDGATWIRGNGERWTAQPGKAPDDESSRAPIAACARGARRAGRRALGALPESARDRRRRAPATRSPVSDVRSFVPEPADDEDELLDGRRRAAARLRPHAPAVPASRGHGGIELVNPGSVGMPFDGDHRAAYALRARRRHGRASPRRLRPRRGGGRGQGALRRPRRLDRDDLAQDRHRQLLNR